jgi:hypothetical protein
MAHYARINENNIVTDVIVIANDIEENALDFIAKELKLSGTWLQTSYNTREGVHLNGGTPFRGNFAGVGYIYDQAADAFIPPKPGANWKIDYTKYVWNPPIPQPEEVEGYVWRWSEVNQEWCKFPLE